jgi:hypothetical protein
VILEESPEEAAKLAVLTSNEKSTDEGNVADTTPTTAATDAPASTSDAEDASESLSYQNPSNQEQQ